MFYLHWFESSLDACMSKGMFSHDALHFQFTKNYVIAKGTFKGIQCYQNYLNQNYKHIGSGHKLCFPLPPVVVCLWGFHILAKAFLLFWPKKLLSFLPKFGMLSSSFLILYDENLWFTYTGLGNRVIN